MPRERIVARLAVALALALPAFAGAAEETRRALGDDVRAVDFRGAGALTILRGEESSLVVRTEGRLEDVLVEVEDGRVVVRPKRYEGLVQHVLGGVDRIEVTVVLPALDSITVGGAAQVEVRGATGERLDLELAGVHECLLADLDVRHLRAMITGASDCVVDGRVEIQEIELSGAGDWSAGSLDSERAEIELSGAGDARVHVSERLVARVSGLGDVRYSGEPGSVEETVSGFGSIRPVP